MTTEAKQARIEQQRQAELQRKKDRGAAVKRAMSIGFTQAQAPFAALAAELLKVTSAPGTTVTRAMIVAQLKADPRTAGIFE